MYDLMALFKLAPADLSLMHRVSYGGMIGNGAAKSQHNVDAKLKTFFGLCAG